MLAGHLLSVFRSLRHRDYRLYYLGQLISPHGSWMQTVASAWLVYRLTSSSFTLGLVAFCGLAPVLLFSVIGGVAADRYSRRKLLITAQTAALIQALALATLTFGGWVEPWHLVVLSLALGLGQAFEMPARHSFVTEMVPREDLSNGSHLIPAPLMLLAS